MRNKGQITLFIIMGFVVIIAVFILMNIRSEKMEIESELKILREVPIQFSPIFNFIESCIKEKIKDGAYLIAIHGGQLKPDSNSFIAESQIMRYFLKDGIDTSPELHDIEEDLAKFINDTLQFCLNDFQSFKDQGFIIDDSYIDINVTILPDKINAILIKGYKVRLNDEIFIFDYTLVTEKLKLGKMYEMAKKLSLEEQISDGINLGELSNSEFEIIAYPYDSENIIYTITDNSTDPPFIFIFATKNKANSHPLLETIPEQNLKMGDKFLYFLSASDPDGDVLTFSTDSNFLSLDPLIGEISFTPSEPGRYIAEIIVEDTHNAKDVKSIIFNVDEREEGLVDIELISEIVIPVGKFFSYQISAISYKNEKLSYSTNTPLININKDTGLLEFTPMAKGSYDVEVKVEDQSGNFDEEIIHFRIVEYKMPIINTIWTLYATVNKKFSFQVNAKSEYPVKFYDNTDLFEISKDGKIEFIPSKTGIYIIEIKAANIFGDYSTENMELIVKNE